MPAKRPVQRAWFDQFNEVADIEAYAWMWRLGIQAEKIVSFGCPGSIEPFILMWIFDAYEIAVVEKEEKYINEFVEERIERALNGRYPECMEGRTVKPIVADMTNPVSELEPDYSDLAFCMEVLYIVNKNQPNFEKVQTAIHEMARVVRPGGYVVSVESKVNVEFDETGDLWNSPVPLNEPSDIGHLFINAGLEKVNHDLGSFVYVYRKPVL